MLSRLVQFYIKLGCKAMDPDVNEEPVLLQYTTDGGITWITLEQFDFEIGSHSPAYKVIKIPDQARTNATRLRWRQTSQDGTFLENWALDQVYFCHCTCSMLNTA